MIRICALCVAQEFIVEDDPGIYGLKPRDYSLLAGSRVVGPFRRRLPNQAYYFQRPVLMDSLVQYPSCSIAIFANLLDQVIEWNGDGRAFQFDDHVLATGGSISDIDPSPLLLALERL